MLNEIGDGSSAVRVDTVLPFTGCEHSLPRFIQRRQGGYRHQRLNRAPIGRRNVTDQRPMRMVFQIRVRIRSIFSGIASNANNLPIMASLG